MRPGRAMAAAPDGLTPADAAISIDEIIAFGILGRRIGKLAAAEMPSSLAAMPAPRSFSSARDWRGRGGWVLDAITGHTGN